MLKRPTYTAHISDQRVKCVFNGSSKRQESSLLPYGSELPKPLEQPELHSKVIRNLAWGQQGFKQKQAVCSLETSMTSLWSALLSGMTSAGLQSEARCCLAWKPARAQLDYMRVLFTISHIFNCIHIHFKTISACISRD